MPYSKHPRLKRFVQIMRAAAYGMLSGAGATIFYVGDPPFGWMYTTMALLMLLGGTLCLLGQLADLWLGELLGLPLVGTAMAAFGLLVARDTHWDLLALPSILILLGVGVMFFMRWTDQIMLARSARFLAHRGLR